MKRYAGIVLIALMVLLTIASANMIVGAPLRGQPPPQKRYVKLCDFRLKSGKLVPIYGEVPVRTCWRGGAPYAVPISTTDPNVVAMLQQILLNQNALMVSLNALHARAAVTPAAPAPVIVMSPPSAIAGPAGPPGPIGPTGPTGPAAPCPGPTPLPTPAPPVILPPPVVPIIPPPHPTPGGVIVPVAPPTVVPVAPPTVTPVAPPTVVPVAPPTFVPIPPAAGSSGTVYRGMTRFTYYRVIFPALQPKRKK